MWQMFSTVDRFSFVPLSVIEMYKIMHAVHVCTNTAGCEVKAGPEQLTHISDFAIYIFIVPTNLCNKNV